MAMPLPPAAAVARMLGDLVGRDVTAKPMAPARSEPGTKAIATYLGECKTIRAIAFCDVPAGASLGAALVVVPPAVVDDSVKARQIDETLVENLYEVFNVLSAVFPQHGAERVLLRDLKADGAIADDVKAFLKQPTTRLDLEISVAGYRSGRLAILAG